MRSERPSERVEPKVIKAALLALAAICVVGCDGAGAYSPAPPTRSPKPLAIPSPGPANHRLRVEFANGGSSIPKGRPVVIRVSFENLPASSGLDVSIVRDVEWSIGQHFAGQTGPLLMTAYPVGASGPLELPWDGRRVACAPADGPMWCEPMEVGRYRLHAVVHDQPGRHAVMRTTTPPPRVIAEAWSEPFAITGAPDLRALAASMTNVAASEMNYSVRPPDNRIRVSPVGTVSRRAGRYCLDFRPDQPYRGRLTTCAPTSVFAPEGLDVSSERITVTGRIYPPA